MDLRNESSLSGRLASLRPAWQKLHVGHYTQMFPPISLTPATLVGTFDFHHSIPLSLNFTFAWLQDQHKEKPLGFVFSNMFQPKEMKFVIVMRQFQLSILLLLLDEIYCIRKISAVSLTVSKQQENKHLQQHHQQQQKATLTLACVKTFILVE